MFREPRKANQLDQVLSSYSACIKVSTESQNFERDITVIPVSERNETGGKNGRAKSWGRDSRPQDFARPFFSSRFFCLASRKTDKAIDGLLALVLIHVSYMYSCPCRRIFCREQGVLMTITVIYLEYAQLRYSRYS